MINYQIIRDLIKACYRVIHDGDEKESGEFTVNDKKTDKTKIFTIYDSDYERAVVDKDGSMGSRPRIMRYMPF